jgi:hypothetical protein
MAFGKLAHRLREHDWFAALLELMIVIAGILIALQVSNWNQDRYERKLARQYAQRLHGELQSDIANIALTRVFWKRVADYQVAASEHAETGALAKGSPWATVLAYYQASQLRPFELEDTTFVELRDAGELRLLQDPTLSKGLADYYRSTGLGMIGEILRHNPQYRLQVRGLTPYAVQEYVWTHCWRQRAGADQELIDCPSPITDAEANAILDTYRGNDELLQNLRFWRTQLEVSRLIANNVEAQGKALDKRVQVLLKRSD